MGVPVIRGAVLRAFVAIVALSTVAAAQETSKGRAKWWQSEKFRQELALTADQSARIEAVFQATLPDLRTAKAELDSLETALSNLVADAGTDEAQISQQIDRVVRARGTLSKLRTLMLFRMHRILSPEQRIKFKVLHEHWRMEPHERWRREPGSY